MFRRILCTILLCAVAGTVCIAVLSGCSGDNKTDSQSNNAVSKADTATVEIMPHKFDKSDLMVNGKITLGMTMEEVKATLGEPNSEEFHPDDDFIYGAYTHMQYGDLSLTFYDVTGGDKPVLGSVDSSSKNDKFANGLSAGSSADDLFYAFAKSDEKLPLYFGESKDCYGSYVYGSFTRESFIEEKPTGVIQYAYINKWNVDNEDGNEYTIEYYYFDPLEWNDDKTQCNGDCYSIIFFMDAETDKVTSILLSYDAII